MAKSAFVAQLDQIQQAAAVLLKPLGFRKGGRSFNRVMQQGLVHVITFQMGQFPIGDYVIPGIRESSYGSFAVNLGVHLPCVYHVDYRFPLPKTLMDPHCSISDRLREASGDDCFRFGAEEMPGFVVHQLERVGLAFFDNFRSYEDVLNYFNVHGNLPFRNTGRATLDAAIVNQELGNVHEARQLFLKALETDHEGFRSYVADVARRFGHAVG